MPLIVMKKVNLTILGMQGLIPTAVAPPSWQCVESKANQFLILTFMWVGGNYSFFNMPFCGMASWNRPIIKMKKGHLPVIISVQISVTS